MRFVVLLAVVLSLPVHAQKAGAENLKDLGAIVGVDIKAIDSVMVSPHINCSEEAHHHKDCYVVDNAVASKIMASGGITKLAGTNTSKVCGALSTAPGADISSVIKTMAEETRPDENSSTTTVKLTDPERGDVRIRASKYGGKGGLGVRFAIDDNKSLSVGAGPKNIGITGKIKIR